MSASYFDLLKYAATGQASPSMTHFDRMMASTLMGGVVQALTGIPPLSFKSNGTPLISWSMKGNGSQTSTPTPDAPIMPTFCGKLVGTDWTVPIICAGQTQTVYLGEVPTVRRVKKLVLDGTENWRKRDTPENSYFSTAVASPNTTSGICTHFDMSKRTTDLIDGTIYFGSTAISARLDSAKTVADFKSYLAAQYVAGTPVTVWYVLAEPETAIVNEPIAKIGNYADELHSTDAGVSIPTAKGQNTLTVETELQPSEMTITFKG